MRRKLLSTSARIAAFTIILSACAGGQNNNDFQSSKTQSSEIVTSTSSGSLTESDLEAEHDTPSIDNEQSNVIDGSSLDDGMSSDHRNSPDSLNTPQTEPPAETNSPVQQPEENAVKKITLQIGNNHFMATLENNIAVDALVEMLREAPLTIQMSDYSSFEKVGSLGTNLPTSNEQTTTQSGDIVLYNGDQIVIFYGSNSWSYTRLGKIDDLSGWKNALGNGDVTVTFSVDEKLL